MCDFQVPRNEVLLLKVTSCWLSIWLMQVCSQGSVIALTLPVFGWKCKEVWVRLVMERQVLYYQYCNCLKIPLF